ncbi:hypothetical protein HY086_01915 [Candidatus Gottesmanbacteria bacterium]|nr:hypothetical protein [Candidatus Gottesmanbacteria bacterium]
MKEKKIYWHFLLVGYFVISLGLFLYSYTQVDLNLTLSRITVWQSIQRAFQHIGYFQRPLSTTLYGAIIVGLFLLYGLVLLWIKKGNGHRRNVWQLILLVTAILVFSYPAFSYDIFNYLFAAKELIVYHKNPYLVTPAQFAPVDGWVLFMRWVHLPSAYTPLWTLLTLPAYLLGFGYFLPILFSMKLLIAASYLICARYIEKTLLIVDKNQSLLGLAIFAFNPLVLIEAVVSPHNDMIMMAAVIAAYYFYVRKQTVSAYFLWSISVALKLMTIILLPLFFIGWKRLPAVLLMTAGLLMVVSQREVLPWYPLWIVPFVALLPRSSAALTVTVGASLGLLLRYVPYLYFGNWNPPGDTWKWWLTVVPIGISALVAFFGFMRRSRV